MFTCNINIILDFKRFYCICCMCLQDRTNNLFKQVYEQKSLKGRANDAIASACLYIACRQEGVPRTFKGQNTLLLSCKILRLSTCQALWAVHPFLSVFSTEICAVSRISKKEIGRCFKLILKALETSVDLITTGDFMSRFCSNLGLPKQVQMAATFIARKAVELDLVPGRSPISVAAAAIYMASQASAEKKTQKGKWYVRGWDISGGFLFTYTVKTFTM